MGNVLEFALGLQTSEFLAKLGASAGEVLSFAGLAEVVERAWDHTWEAVGKGAELKALSSATGESVAQLYKLQHGLEAIGASAENPSMLFTMTQKALSGINEQGIHTGILFEKIGLDLTKLSSQDTVQSLIDIGNALGKLNPTQAAGVGEMLFGRFQTQTVLQMARDMKTFQEGMNASSNTAALLDKFASTFEQVKADWGDIESDVLGIWVQIAGSIAPELHKIFSETEEFLHHLEAAFGSGKMGELLKLSLIFGIEEVYSFTLNLFGSANLWKSIANSMIGEYTLAFAAIENAFIDVADTMQTLLDMVVQKFGKNFGMTIAETLSVAGKATLPVNKMLGLGLDAAAAGIATELGLHGAGGSFADQFQKNYQAMDQTLGAFGPGGLTKSGVADLKNAGTDVAKAIADAMKNASAPDKAALEALWKSLGNLNLAPGSGGPGGPRGKVITPMENHMHPEFTSLEKMGFVFSTGGKKDGIEQHKITLLEQIHQAVVSLHPSATKHNPILHPHGHAL